MDWAMDPQLPHRFRQWKRLVINELRLQMAEDPKKTKAYACTYVIVCAGEQGEQIIKDAGLLDEAEDYQKILQCLEDSVNPTSNFLEDSLNYFILKQGDMSVRQFLQEAERLIERMIPNYDLKKTMTHPEVKSLLLRNLLIVGLKHKGVLKECHRLKPDECTDQKILQLAYQAEIRDAANQRMAQSLASSQSSALQEMTQSGEQSSVNRIQSQRSTTKGHSTRKRSCRWCGGAQLCKRTECPANGHECSYCGKMGHFSRVCLQKKTTAQAEQRKLHNVDLAETEDLEQCDPPVSVFSFKQLSDNEHGDADHIKPLWLMVPNSTQVHKTLVEIDTGAACNVMPSYMYRNIFGGTTPEKSNARIRACGDTPVMVLGKCTVLILTADGETKPASL